MTRDFIHASQFCRFIRPLSENVAKNVNFAPFSTRHYNGVLWKTHFFLLLSCIKTFTLRKLDTISFSKTNITQYGSMIEVYIKA